jgi:hypothetical protein
MTPNAWIWCLLAVAPIERLVSFEPSPRNFRSSRTAGLAAAHRMPSMDLNGNPLVPPPILPCESPTRRTLFRQCANTAAAALVLATLSAPLLAQAAPADCYTDCFENCRALAPKDTVYCQESCRDYCEQPDRQDGLSGSVSAAQGEVGILGGTFGTGTVVKGSDKPPTIALPGLDFTSSAGKKLIGY